MSISTLEVGNYNGFHWELKRCIMINGQIYDDFYFKLPDDIDNDVLNRYDIQKSSRDHELYFITQSLKKEQLFKIFDRILYDVLI